MERSREARRGSMAALNGGLSRRRQRTGGLRDSPEADGGMEMAETTRLRERAARKERDRDRERDRERERSGRSKRRRGERMMLHDSNRDEGDDTSDDSVDEEDDEDDTVSATTAVRLLPPPLPPNNPPSMVASAAHGNSHYHHHQQQNNNHHHLQQQQQQQQQQQLLLQRKSFPAKSPAVWKTDEMIGVQVPRKARSASTKRSSHEWLVSGSGGGGGAGGGNGGGGGGGGVVDPSQIPPSPSRMSPASTSQISPSSSNASVRKKMKPVIGSKQRPPKIAKQASFIQEEIEVAEVLFGMTRQFQGPLKQESDAVDSRDANAGFANESRSAASPPNTASPHPPPAQQSVLGPSESSSNPSTLPAAVAVKRKRPRFLKSEDESTVTTTPGSVAASSATAMSAVKMEAEHQVKSEAALPKSEKNGESVAHENGGSSVPGAAASEVAAAAAEKQDSDVKERALVPELKLSGGESDKHDPPEKPREAVAPAKEAPCNDLADLDTTNRSKTTSTKITSASDGIREKFTIDLMAPPPGKFSPERDGSCNFDAGHGTSATEIDMVSRLNAEKKEDKAGKDEVSLQRKKVEELPSDEFNPKKQVVKERNLDLQLDLEQPDRDGPSSSKMQFDKLQTRASEAEPKREKAALAGSLPVPMPVAGWPGNFPSFGYVGQVPSLPAVVPLDANSRSSNMLQPPVLISPEPRPKRCATHCYIAKSIHYQQQLAKMNPFWPAAAGTAPPYGAKPYNLSLVPPAGAAALFGSQMQGMFSGRNMGPLQGSREIPMVTAISGNPSNEKISTSNNAIGDPAHRKEPILQQAPQGPSAANILHGPAFILPLNQQQQAAVAAAAAASAASRAGATTSVAGVTSGPLASGASGASVATSKAGGSAPAVNLSFAGLRANEAHQYMAILQNNGYPFPIPPHVAGPPSYIGASPPQAMPFFNGSFYPSQMLHPSQLQSQQQQQQPPPPPKQQQPQGPQQPQHVQQGHQNTSTSSVSSSSQKHQRQSSQHAPAGVVNGAAGTSHDFMANSQRHQQLLQQPRKQESDKGIEDNPSAADSRSWQGQKNLYGYSLPMPPTHPLMSAAAASAALGRGGSGASGGHNEKQTVQQQQPPHPTMKVDLTTSQAMTMAMPFASLNGVAAPPGLDFSSVVQNHALFQSLPEAARHAINSQLTAAVAAASAEAAQQKKAQHPISEDRKGHAANSDNSRKDDRKMVASVKAPGNGLQHSFTFSKPDAASQIPSIRLDTVLDSSSKTLSLIPGQMHHSTSTPASSTTAAGATMSIPNSQQPQLMQNQKQQQQQQQLQQQQQMQQQQQQQLQQQQQMQQLQQQQMQMQQQLASSRMKPSALSSSAGAYTERLSAGSTGGKFPQTQAALPGFPPGLIPSGGSTRAAMPFSVPVSTPISKNSTLPQQQFRSSPSQQTQISFGVNSMKGVPSRTASNPPSSAAAASTAVVGSPQNSTSKGSGESLGVSTSAKPGQSTVTSPHPQQSSVKHSPSNSTQKSSSANNRSLPSILGQPQLSPAPNANTKSQQQQQQQQQQLQRQQAFPQPQLYFSPGYMQQSNAAAAAYYQKRPAEQAAQQQQQILRPGSMGLLALSPSSQAMTGAVTAGDPAKSTAAANGVKGGMPQPGLLHAPGNPHAIMSATFPCMSMQPVSIKPAATDQKPAAGK